MITLSVPGALEFRDVAVRVVGAACKLFGPHRSGSASPDGTPAPPPVSPLGGTNDLADEFVMQVVSAFSEAFNNLAIHGYRRRAEGRVDIEISAEITNDQSGALVIHILDTGEAFDPAQYLEMPDELPERGMGLFIMRSFIDDIRYEKGPPHKLTLVKRWQR